MLNRVLFFFVLLVLVSVGSKAGEWKIVAGPTVIFDTPKKIAAYDSLNFSVVGYHTGINAGVYELYSYFSGTSDGGKNWTTVRLSDSKTTGGDPLLYTSLQYYSPKEIIALGTGQRLLKSINGGATWDSTIIDDGSDLWTNPDVRFDSTKKYAALIWDALNLFYSKDSCKSWNKIYVGFKFSSNNFIPRSPIMLDDSTIYLYYYDLNLATGKLVKTNNLFKNYEVVDVPTGYTSNINFFDKKLGFLFCADTATGNPLIFKTTDSGNNWKKCRIKDSLNIYSVSYNVTAINKDEFFGNFNNSYFYTNDRGENWELVDMRPNYLPLGLKNANNTGIGTDGKGLKLFFLNKYLLKYFESNSSISENMSNTCEANIYPNPCAPGRIVNLKIDKVGNSNADYLLYNEIGTIVSQGNVSLTDGIANITIPDNIANGSYTILMLVDSESVYAKISVQR